MDRGVEADVLAELDRTDHDTSWGATTRPSEDFKARGSILARGSRVGRYEIEGILGSGAMGTVYSAYDPDIDRRVAVKTIRLDSYDSNRRARVLREAQAMARVVHPDVIVVHDVGAYEAGLFIAMELVVGGTLREWLRTRPRSTREILDVLRRAGRALAEAHAVGVVHRDFKPDNVLVGDDGRVRVTDFGLARAVRGEDAEATHRAIFTGGEPGIESPACLDLTRTGAMLGTPAYMSPEQLRGEQASVRSDIFSFCVTLWEALYGQRPYSAKTLPGLEAKIRRGEIDSAEGERPDLGSLRDVLRVGLAAESESRFPSMSDLLIAMEGASVSRLLWPTWRVARPAAMFAALMMVAALTVAWLRSSPVPVTPASKVANTVPVSTPAPPSALAFPAGEVSPPSIDPVLVPLPPVADRSSRSASAPALPRPKTAPASPARDPFGPSRK